MGFGAIIVFNFCSGNGLFCLNIFFQSSGRSRRIHASHEYSLHDCFNAQYFKTISDNNIDTMATISLPCQANKEQKSEFF